MRTKVNEHTPGRRWDYDAAREKAAFPDVTEDDFWSVTEEFWDYSLCGVPALYHVYRSLRYILENRIDGDIVECGVYLGGTVMFAAEICRRHDVSNERQIFALDTFGGFVSRIEGVDNDYEGNPICQPNLKPNDFTDKATNNMRSVGFDQTRLHILKGDVAKTIPTLPQRSIALLRLDTDTYETTKLELNLLHDRVTRGGVVIIDDYGYNVGCAQAVKEFAHGRMILPMRQDRFGRSWVKVTD
jgi:O-methyltransferase